MYRDAHNKANVKKKACGSQFGGLANKTALAMQANEESSPKKEPDTLEKLEGWFDSLTTTDVTGKDSIEALLKNNTLLTKTNAKLPAVIKPQAAEIKSLTTGDGVSATGAPEGLAEMEPSQISPPLGEMVLPLQERHLA